MTSFDPTSTESTEQSAAAFGVYHGYCEARQRLGVETPPGGFPLFVFDMISDDALQRPAFWPTSGCGDLGLDMSADGLTVVAEASSNMAGVDLSSCPGDPNALTGGTFYEKQQIVSWRRDAVGEPFDDPVLITASTSQPAGCSDAVTPVPGAPSALLGVGGNWNSYQPSMNSAGTRVVFASVADNLGIAPTSANTRALFVSDVDGQNLEMVTPDGFDGSAHRPQISSDGNTVVFESNGTGLGVTGVSAGGPMQVYVAKRVGLNDWDIELVSEKDGLPLDGASHGPQLSPDGTRVVYATSADEPEAGRTDTSGPGEWLVARDLAAATPVNQVFVTPSGAAFAADGGLGDPEMAPDGARVAVMASKDGKARFRLFDVDAAFGGETERTGAFVADGSRSFLGDHDRPLGLGGNTTKNLVGFGGGPLLERYKGAGPSLYLGRGGQIGPGISKGLHGDPVDTANGAFVQDEVDLVADRAPQFMAVARSYSSVGEQSGVFGPGWGSPIDTRLDVSGEAGTVTLELPSGRGVTYVEAGGVWSTAMGYRSRLVADGANWEVVDPNGDRWFFNSEGNLTGWSSRDSAVELGARSLGVPATITASDGDVLTLTDNKKLDSAGAVASGPDGYVDRITSSTGSVVDYGYSLNGAGTVLSLVSDPHLAGQPAGSYGGRSYEYAGSRITKIADQVTSTRWKTVVENTYDDLGRVVFQVTDTGDELTFDYGLKPNPPGGLAYAPGFTTVTNAASGDVTVYEYSVQGEVLGITDTYGNSVGRSWENEQPGSSTSRSGVETDYAYDAAGRVLSVTETVGSSTVVTASYTYVVPDTDPEARADTRVATSTDAAGVTTTLTYNDPATGAVPDSSSVPCVEASLGSELDCPSNGLATTTFSYDTGGHGPLLTEQVDPDGVRTSRTYHSDGTLASSTVYDDGDVARTTTCDRWEPDHPDWPFTDPSIAWADRTEQPGGEVSWSAYNAAGLVVETRDPLYDGDEHGATTTTYNLDGSVASVTDPSGRPTFFEVKRAADYDPDDPFDGWEEDPSIAEVRMSVDADGVASINKIDRSGDTVVSQVGDLDTPAELATTTSTYGPLGRLDHTVGPTGVRTSYHYDTEGAVTGVTIGDDPGDAAQTSTTEFDGRGRVVAETTPMGTNPDGAAVQRKITYTYDDAGRKVSQLEGAGGPAGEQLLTGFEYDAAGRLWRTIEHRHAYTDTANPTVLHTADRVSETRYTVGGRVAEQVGPPVDVATLDWSGPDSTKAITSYGYDEAGRQVTVEAPDGGVTETVYDVNGRVASTTSPGGIETSFVYDAAGRQIEVVTPSGLTGSGDPATVSRVTGYDPAGRVISETDPHIPETGVVDPSTRFTQYTSGGRVSEVTDALGNTVTYSYDSRGNRTSRTALNDAGAPVVESWTYNLADQVLTHTVPPPEASMSAKTTTSTYDPEFGRLATVTDPTSRVATHEYYNEGTPRSTTYSRLTSAPSVARFWVNGRGWRTKSTLTTGSTVTPMVWTYDRAGQVVSETTRGQNPVTHTYGLAGDKRTLGYPDGAVGSYLHDPAGRITEVSLSSGGVTVPYASYTYDADGRETSELIHAAGGAVRTRSYDDAGRLASLTEVLPSSTSTWETYTAVLTYRPDGRLGTETVNSEPTITYGYDDAGQMTSAVDGVRDRSWSYGTRGNRLTAVDDGVTTTYDTSPNGSVAKTTTGSDTVTYRYDDAGRRRQTVSRTGTTTTASTSTTFDTRGLPGYLTSAATSMATKAEYRLFDADGKYIGANISAGGPVLGRSYMWDTTGGVPQIIQAKNQGAITFRSVWGNRRIGFKPTTSAPQWFQYDVRDSVIRTDPANTDVVEGPESYGPHGEAEGTLGYDSFGYRSELTNSALVHLRNRDYDPVSGQFTSRDPLDGVNGTPGVANPYQYADNDPHNRTDPLGLQVNDDDLSVLASATAEDLAIAKAEAAVEASRSSLFVRTVGMCADFSASVTAIMGLSVSASACFLIDKKSYWGSRTYPDSAMPITSTTKVEGLSKLISAATTLTGGYVVSNASDASEMGGHSWCLTIMGGSGLGGEVTACLGTENAVTRLDSKVEYTGIWSVYGGIGVGAGGGLAIVASNTKMNRLRDRFRIPLINRDPVCEAMFVYFTGASGIACPPFE